MVNHSAGAGQLHVVGREDVEELEHLLSLSDALKRQFESDVKFLQRELDDTSSTAKREQHALRMSRDALQDEIHVMRSRLEAALAENDDLIRSIEPMEFEIRLLRRQVSSNEESASLAGAVGGGGSSHRFAAVNSSRASSSHRTTDDFRGYFSNADDDVHNGADTISGRGASPIVVNSTPALQSREQQLLEVIEQSASVFVSLDLELRTAQAELQRLKAEKQNWQSSEYELQGSIARLEREREQYIARELENTSSYVLASHSLIVEETKGRKLLESQADAVLHGLAYQRCRNDAAVISKQLRTQLNAMELERNRDHRHHDNHIKFEVERAKAALSALHEKTLRELDTKLETMRLERQKVELQNVLLKANCDEWRAHSEKKDRDHEKAQQQLVGEAQTQMAGRDEILRSRDAQIIALQSDNALLTTRVSEAERSVVRADSALRRMEADQQRRIESLRTSYVQTDPTESAEDMKRRLLREIEDEDEVQLARRVTSHHVFIKLQDLATNLRMILDDKEKEVVHLRSELQTTRNALETTAQRLATEERTYTDGVELLRCEADAANRRADLVQRQREIAEREVMQLQTGVERHQTETARVLVELRDALAGRRSAEQRCAELATTLDSLTAQLGVELSEGASKSNTLDELVIVTQTLREDNLRLHRAMLESEESASRANLSHSVDVILMRLSSIAEAMWSGAVDDAAH